MPATVLVRVVCARDLPVMDRSSDLTDAFAEVKLGNEIHRTEVCHKSLNPEWDSSSWFKFNVSDEVIQDEPLQIKIMDYDTYTAHDTIGRVYICLNSMMAAGSGNTTSLNGWFPIFDTLHGVRGHVYLRVKLEIIVDKHRFKQSSCEVLFFNSRQLPAGYPIQAFHGFVEELVVNDDPEYQWIDKIRTPRSSNEARQRIFLKLSGELQRRIGLKVLEVEGNAVIGYHQCFDLEGDYGIVARGFGTCVTLTLTLPSTSTHLQPSTNNTSTNTTNITSTNTTGVRGPSLPPPLPPPPPPPSHGSSGPLPLTPRLLQRQSDDVDPQLAAILPGSPPTAAMSPLCLARTRTTSTSSSEGGGGAGGGVPTTPSKTGAMGEAFSTMSNASPLPSDLSRRLLTTEFPFYTLTSFPLGTVRHFGGLVSARAVKLLDKINNPEESETRDGWWLEVRNEVRSHARAMNCNAVIGYAESTSICDTLCVLSAIGTAVVISFKGSYHRDHTVGKQQQQQQHVIGHKKKSSLGSMRFVMDATAGSKGEPGEPMATDDRERDGGGGGGGEIGDGIQAVSSEEHLMCGSCHIPYSTSKLPFEMKLSKCSCCSEGMFVPSVILSTSELPEGVLTRGNGCLVQARVCNARRKVRGDENAFQVSKELPFLEYMLHRRFLNKLRIQGMNSAFGVRVQVTVGENMLTGVTTGTGVYLEALPPPHLVVIETKDTNSQLLPADVQGKINRIQERNRKKHHLHQAEDVVAMATGDHVTASASSTSASAASVANSAGVGGSAGMGMGVGEGPGPGPGVGAGVGGEGLDSELDLVSSGTKKLIKMDVEPEQGLKEEDLLDVLGNDLLLSGFLTSTLCAVPGLHNIPTNGANSKMVTVVAKRMLEDSTRQPTESQFIQFFDKMLQNVMFKARHLHPCVLTDLTFDLDIPDENELQLVVCAVVTSQKEISTSKSEELIFQTDEGLAGKPSSSSAAQSDSSKTDKAQAQVQMTTLPQLLGFETDRYLGVVNLFLIRESTSVREEGGLDRLLHVFILEAHSIARAHVRALGGNALLSYRLNQCVLIEHLHKNQAQYLLNLSGDAALLRPVVGIGAVASLGDASRLPRGEGGGREDATSTCDNSPHEGMGAMMQMVELPDSPRNLTGHGLRTNPVSEMSYNRGLHLVTQC